MVQWCDDNVIYSKTFINIMDLWNEKSIECEHKMTKMLFTMKYFWKVDVLYFVSMTHIWDQTGKIYHFIWKYVPEVK